ncbi:hypothetical protein FOA52_003918 [Chlamydomonas sp. UWO 241]|nr:hypothetical protein FOA52_003918 [Chlamydomonas sp. UWO 241]
MASKDSIDALQVAQCMAPLMFDTSRLMSTAQGRYGATVTDAVLHGLRETYEDAVARERAAQSSAEAAFYARRAAQAADKDKDKEKENEKDKGGPVDRLVDRLLKLVERSSDATRTAVDKISDVGSQVLSAAEAGIESADRALAKHWEFPEAQHAPAATATAAGQQEAAEAVAAAAEQARQGPRRRLPVTEEWSRGKTSVVCLGLGVWPAATLPGWQKHQEQGQQQERQQQQKRQQQQRQQQVCQQVRQRQLPRAAAMAALSARARVRQLRRCRQGRLLLLLLLF